MFYFSTLNIFVIKSSRLFQSHCTRSRSVITTRLFILKILKTIISTILENHYLTNPGKPVGTAEKTIQSFLKPIPLTSQTCSNKPIGNLWKPQNAYIPHFQEYFQELLKLAAIGSRILIVIDFKKFVSR